MKLVELKQRAYNCWECLSTFNEAIVQPERFKAEVRSFGDLRCKDTWKKAYCSFVARNICDSCLDAYNLILIQFNYKPSDWNYELRHEIFEEFLTLPEALDLLKTGLEQLFSTDFTQKEREEAYGFFRLAREQSTRRGIDGQTAQLMGRLTINN